MANLLKEKIIQIGSLLLLMMSYFMPWFTTSADESGSLFMSFKILWKVLLIENESVFISSWEYGVWDTITVNLLQILILCSVLLPILSGITIYRIYRNRKYKVYKNSTVIIAIALIVTYLNFFFYSVYWEWEPSLKQGFFIALISLIVFVTASAISRKMTDLISNHNIVNVEEKPPSMPSPHKINYCSNCGDKIEDNANFCMNCGKKLTGTDSFFENLITNFPVLKSKKGLAIIGIIIVASIILFGKQSPSDVANDFIKATQVENYDKAEKLWSNSGKEYMLEQLGDERWIYQSMRNFTHRTGGDDLVDYRITQEEKTENDMINIYATFQFSSGEQRDAELAMIKEDGEWKVFAFNSY
ncbi:zinc-ribbon domain-containing protein [Neobacillus sp. YIM B06451]|uniref:zinc ribbon domain-containing protein n=1 Tax=Neobacillus sp. YIM B06451 TaxID=3070994 RepID=UPI002930F6EB|nr:zinc-ribbon domain-containing protein [Neobacillus sp. YIM B06451]